MPWGIAAVQEQQGLENCVCGPMPAFPLYLWIMTSREHRLDLLT
jgi:hypothetical protein